MPTAATLVGLIPDTRIASEIASATASQSSCCDRSACPGVLGATRLARCPTATGHSSAGWSNDLPAVCPTSIPRRHLPSVGLPPRPINTLLRSSSGRYKQWSGQCLRLPSESLRGNRRLLPHPQDDR